MMKTLQILLLLVPLCSGQFRIQGPSDGNRRAQGLKYDAEKGIEYDDQRASLGAGDFSITGASDGNSDFKIQGASDGNSDFQIHGATDGNANFHIRGPTDANAQFQIQGATDGNADFHIQGATDGNANFQIQGATDGNANFHIQGATDGQSHIQEPYDANQRGALQYKDSSGSTVNWKSYNVARAQPQVQPQQYEEPQYAPAPRRKAHRRPVAQSQPPPAAPENNYKVYNTAPPQIQQLLQYQQQIPYQNIIPQQYRYDFHGPPPPALAPQEHQQEQEPAPVAPLPQEQPSRSQYRGKARGPARRQKRAAQRQKQHKQQPQLQRVAGPPAEPQHQLSTNVPSRIQELLQFQAQIPYQNHIPEQWRYERLLEQEKNLPPPQYERQPAPQTVRHSQKVRQKREAQHQNAQPHYKTNLPPQLAELLKFQASTPYTSVIPEQYSYEKLLAAQKSQHREKRQAPHYQHNEQPQGGLDLSQYTRVSQPQHPQQPAPQYSSSIPGSIKQLLQFQSQVPYDIIANKITFRLDKPYVPQPVKPTQPAPISQTPQHVQRPSYRAHQPQYEPAAQPQYQAPEYQPSQPQYQSPLQYQPSQPQYQPSPQYHQSHLLQPTQPESQSQYQQSQSPLYQPQPLAQPQYQQSQSTLLHPAPLPQPQRPVYQNPQYQQSQLHSQFHPNQIPQYDRSYSQPVRPVTENQY